jgi:site-specific DNA-methyltransferase (adenine-specific)
MTPVLTPHYDNHGVTLYHGDCLEVLRELSDNSVDSVVTDPPYELGFMGKGWDATGIAYNVAMWGECLRVLKPGGHLISFGGTRTYHRMACAIEDAGFEIRDSLVWMYGSGFPKAMDVSKAIDKAAGATREVVGTRVKRAGDMRGGNYGNPGEGYADIEIADTVPATSGAVQWQGWATALKPAFEPIVLARKPLAGTVAANVLEHGTGALNIDGCRIGFANEADERESKDKNRHADFGTEPGGNAVYGDFSMVERTNYDAPGRWPANVTLDTEAAALLDEQSGKSGTNTGVAKVSAGKKSGGGSWAQDHGMQRAGAENVGIRDHGDFGGASRFFYTAKAGADERPVVDGVAHVTVKPLDLMRWLVRLVTPQGGAVLEPFAGSGTTAEACVLEGMRCIAIEREEKYLDLTVARISKRRDPVTHHKLTKTEDDEPSLFDLL